MLDVSWAFIADGVSQAVDAGYFRAPGLTYIVLCWCHRYDTSTYVVAVIKGHSSLFWNGSKPTRYSFLNKDSPKYLTHWAKYQAFDDYIDGQ